MMINDPTYYIIYIYIYIIYIKLPELWSSTSWIALPPSSCLIWESAHVILKSSRKVAGRAPTDTEYKRIQKQRDATEFLNEGQIIVAIWGLVERLS